MGTALTLFLAFGVGILTISAAFSLFRALQTVRIREEQENRPGTQTYQRTSQRH